MSKKLIQAAAGAGGESVYVEDVFSTYVYEGNSSTQTITNGIDLSGEGGLIWTKARSSGSLYHTLRDTERGTLKYLKSNSTEAEGTNNAGTNIYQVNSDGYELGLGAQVNGSGNDYVSWTFRKQAGFFDVVTWTGDGTSNRQITHNLGSVPGCIIVKRLNSTANWAVWHRGFNSASTIGAGFLNLTNAFGNEALFSNNSSSFSDSYFLVSSSTNRETNGYLDTYVAYVFAHDDQSFGDDSDESIIKCGSFTAGTFYGLTGDLGWEPQWFLVKESSGTSNWTLIDNMRGIGIDANDSRGLRPNTSSAEENVNIDWDIENQGTRGLRLFGAEQDANQSYIYIAIRRPMKTPEAGTDVFKAVTYNGANNATQEISAGFPIDMDLIRIRTASASRDALFHTRLLGKTFLKSTSSSAEASFSDNVVDFGVGQNVIELPAGTGTNEINGDSSSSYIAWFFKRAAGYFDVVAYTGTGSATTVNHNLGVAPELIFVKVRSTSDNWVVYYGDNTGKYLQLNVDQSAGTNTNVFTTTAPTSSVFSVGTDGGINGSSSTYIAYLFGTVTGVSKVGSYTGTGSTINVDCGFSSGARFILIKRTDSAGDWYVWDSTRGINSGSEENIEINTTNDPSSVDDIDPLSSGFQVVSTNAEINTSGGNYIFLAIA